MNVSFRNHNIENLPLSNVLEKIGTRVQSLSLWDCAFEDQVIVNIISNCGNLRSFSVEGQFSFCSPQVLEMIDLVQPKLESLTIIRIRDAAGGIYHSDDYETWERTFKSLLRIFPSVVQFYVGFNVYDIDENEFWCGFSKKPNIEYESSLVSVLALSMTYSVEHWRKALIALSTLRFVYLWKIYLLK